MSNPIAILFSVLMIIATASISLGFINAMRSNS
jgi:hypothetical protein